MSSNTSKKQLSLLNPNLTGLGSSSYLHDTSFLSKCLGFFVVFIIIFSWIFGYACAMFVFILYYFQYKISSLILGLLIFTPYFLPFGRKPWFARFLMYHKHFFFPTTCIQYVVYVFSLNNV